MSRVNTFYFQLNNGAAYVFTRGQSPCHSEWLSSDVLSAHRDSCNTATEAYWNMYALNYPLISINMTILYPLASDQTRARCSGFLVLTAPNRQLARDPNQWKTRAGLFCHFRPFCRTHPRTIEMIKNKEKLNPLPNESLYGMHQTLRHMWLKTLMNDRDDC